MKIRLTLGNFIGLVSTVAGAIVAHEQIISLVANSLGGKIAAAGVIILGIAKSLVDTDPETIPEGEKATLGPVVLQKTGLLK